MSFRDILKSVCDGLEGAVACSLMGADGIEVETHVASDVGGIDLKSFLVECSGLFRGAREAADVNQAGSVSEIAVHTEKLAIVARLVSPDYFMAVALSPEGNQGKARHLLRITAPRVRAEL